MQDLCGSPGTPSPSRCSSPSSPTKARVARNSRIVSSGSEREGGEGMPAFAEWESFYVIVGTAAAALIGLQFVVMTLIADRPQITTAEAGAAFATPTIVHFSAVLLL